MSDEERPDGGMTDTDIASRLGVGQAVVEVELVHPARIECRVCMRDGSVLDTYQRSYDENEALVCMDGTSKQQVGETR